METPSTLLLIVLVFAPVRLSTQHGGYEINPDREPEDSLRHSEFVRNKEHLKEHLTDFEFDPEKATPEELDFHFFKTHDVNDDNNLDGLELLQAIHHAVHEQLEVTRGHEVPGQHQETFRENIRLHLIAIVDKILADDDADKNGYINYMEFAQTRRASEMLMEISNKNN